MPDRWNDVLIPLSAARVEALVLLLRFAHLVPLQRACQASKGQRRRPLRVSARLPRSLQAATPTKDQVEEHKDEDEVDAAAAVVAQTGPCVVTATAKQDDKDDEQDNHAAESSTGR